MKIAIIANQTNINVANQLTTLIQKNNKFEIIKIENDADFFKTMDNASNALKNNKVERIIVLDEYGILPFMYLSKNYHMVVAEISDEHSGHMTAEHNGSNCITLGTKLLALEQMYNVSMQYLNDKYAGGRHESRIDMLKAQLKGEC